MLLLKELNEKLIDRNEELNKKCQNMESKLKDYECLKTQNKNLRKMVKRKKKIVKSLSDPKVARQFRESLMLKIKQIEGFYSKFKEGIDGLKEHAWNLEHKL